MDTNLLLSRTPKGDEAAASRAHRISYSMRAVLLRIEKPVTVRALLDQYGEQAAGLVQDLLEQGFIETRHAPPEQTAAHARDPGAETGPQALAVIRRAIARAIHEALGPSGDDLAMRVEELASAAAIRQHLAAQAALYETAMGKKRSQAFFQRCAAILDGPGPER